MNDLAEATQQSECCIVVPSEAAIQTGLLLWVWEGWPVFPWLGVAANTTALGASFLTGKD